MDKFIQRFAPALCAFAILIGVPAIGTATLIVDGSIVNTPLLFQANLTWQNSLTFDELDMSPSDTPWDITARASSVASFALIFAQHTMGPHSGDDPFGGNLEIVFTNIAPGVGGGTKSISASHPTEHFDKLTVTIRPSVPGQSSAVSITAQHFLVPEPGTLALGAIGACLLFLRRRSAGVSLR